jgi:putative tricarboxylic transport membrane protein
MSDKSVNIYLGIFSIILSSIIYIFIPSQVSMEPIPGTGDLVKITPAAIPYICVTAFIVIGCLLIISSIFLNEETQSQHEYSFKADGLVRGLVTLLIVISYPFLLELLGYLLTTILILLVLNIYFGTRKLWQLALGVLVLPIFITYIFRDLMYIPLPTGSVLN